MVIVRSTGIYTAITSNQQLAAAAQCLEYMSIYIMSSLNSIDFASTQNLTLLPATSRSNRNPPPPWEKGRALPTEMHV